MKPKPKRKPALWTLAYPEQVHHPVKRPKKKAARKPIRSRSAAMSKRMVEYGKAAKDYLAKFTICSSLWPDDLCMAISTEVHHKKGRAGKLLMDQKHWLPVCAKCHSRIHAQPALAEKYGNLDPSGWRHARRTYPA
jgi:hypothetical protein